MTTLPKVGRSCRSENESDRPWFARKAVRWTPIAVLPAFLGACAFAPPVSTAAFDDAQAVIDAARSAGAVVLAPQPLYAARVSFEQARLLADDGDAAAAREALASSVQQATRARQLTAAARASTPGALPGGPGSSVGLTR